VAEVELSEIKRLVPLPTLMRRMGYEQHATQSCSSPFREDRNPSWGIFEKEGQWFWKDHGTGESGDEVTFIQRALQVDVGEAIKYYKKAAGVWEEPARIEFSTPRPKMDWDAACKAFTPAMKTRLVEWRGYSEKFVDWLVENRLVGVVQGQLAFPVTHNPKPKPPRQNGSVDGAHLYSKDKGWRMLGGKSAPWVIGEHTENVFAFESQWDAFAFMDALDWPNEMAAVSAVAITRGAAQGGKLKGIFPSTCKVHLFPQNDEEDAEGNSPAKKWMNDIAGSGYRKMVSIATPSEHKDFNDWTRAGATKLDILRQCEQAVEYRDPSAPLLPAPFEWPDLLSFSPDQDEDNVLGNRWLCRGSSCVWVGGSGLGKSVLGLQAAMHWAAGTDFLGIKPVKPLTSLIIEAENDFGDVAETVQGVRRGLEGVDFRAVQERVNILRIVNQTGSSFLDLAADLVAEHEPDMLWIDPLLCYLGGDINSQEEVGNFVNQLGEIALRAGTILQIIHHTGKPKSSKDTKGWTTHDLSYAGIGSSILTNWARAIMVLQSVRGEDETFQLTAAKRGKRAGLAHPATGIEGHTIYLEHTPGSICWRASDYLPEEKSAGRPSVKIDFLEYKEALTGATKHTKNSLSNHISKRTGASYKTVTRRIDNLIDNGTIQIGTDGGLKWTG
tara:strand:+ start:231 stop:2231 length:2001 start_codon:yes stop_codon:yes gene_type:complete